MLSEGAGRVTRRTAPAAAQKVFVGRQSAPAPRRIRVYGEIGVVTGTLDPVAARREGTGERGFGLLLGAGVEIVSRITLGVQGTGQIFHDDSAFTQSTTGGTKSSSVGVFDGVVQASVRLLSFPLAGGGGSRFTVGVGGGWAGFFGHRTIDNCVDCSTETLHFSGGPFWAPVISVENPRTRGGGGVSFLATLRQFGSGAEANDMIVIAARFRF